MKELIISDLNKLYKDKPKRLKHIDGVREKAIELGKRFNADLDKLELASLLHDITKYYTKDKNEEIIRNNYDDADFIMSDYNENILHSFSARVIALKKYYITDEDILSAILHHTVGKPDMNIYEKILFIADYTEPNRTYESCVRVRKILEEDIDKAVYTAINDSINFYENIDDQIPQIAYKARDYYKKVLEDQNG